MGADAHGRHHEALMNSKHAVPGLHEPGISILKMHSTMSSESSSVDAQATSTSPTVFRVHIDALFKGPQ